MTEHFLIHIHFRGGMILSTNKNPEPNEEIIPRHWYAVPSVGEGVEVDLQGNGEQFLVGTVRRIVWTDHLAKVELA